MGSASKDADSKDADDGKGRDDQPLEGSIFRALMLRLRQTNALKLFRPTSLEMVHGSNLNVSLRTIFPADVIAASSSAAPNPAAASKSSVIAKYKNIYESIRSYGLINTVAPSFAVNFIAGVLTFAFKDALKDKIHSNDFFCGFFSGMIHSAIVSPFDNTKIQKLLQPPPPISAAGVPMPAHLEFYHVAKDIGVRKVLTKGLHISMLRDCLGLPFFSFVSSSFWLCTH